MKHKTHAAIGGDSQSALCGVSVTPERIIVGGGFTGTVTCRHCQRLHAVIVARYLQRQLSLIDSSQQELYSFTDSIDVPR